MNYNNNELAYRNMLCTFRTSDLQTLLGMFGQSRTGRKTELRDHAIELLRNRQHPGFNHQVYRSKISEIYAQNQPQNQLQTQQQNQVPNNGLQNLMQNQQRQMISMQPQQQRMYLAAQYPQQQMHLAQPGISQLMVQRTRGMYRNGMGANNTHLQQYSYQLTVSSRNVAQVAPNQQQHQLHLMTSGSMTNAINAPGNNNIYIQHQTVPALPPPVPALPSIKNVKFRSLPFNEVVEGLIAPTYLNPQDRSMQISAPIRDLKEGTFKFRLTGKQATLIGMNRNLLLSESKVYGIDVQLRICHLKNTVNNEIVDCLPIGLAIKINNRHIPLPPAFAKPGTKPGVEPRRVPRPINIAHYIKVNPTMENLITIYWNPDGKLYVMSLNLVKKLDTDILLDRLLMKGGKSSEETKKYIIKKLANDDPDLATTAYRVSLMCPLGKMRMKLPAKATTCTHELQCFDASIYLAMNEKKPTWTCPTCTKTCLYENLELLDYFIDVTTSPALSDSCTAIEVLADGTWRMCEENEGTGNGGTNKKDKPIESVNLDSDDEMSAVDLEQNPQPGCSQDTKNIALRPSLVDLTLSDEDEEPPKSKQENEAQAAFMPIAVDRKPHVQPQQAVTSSEQGEVIEIDSPTPPSSPAATSPLPWGVL